MITVVAFRGATMWEAQIGRLWVTVPYWRFLRVGRRPRVGWQGELVILSRAKRVGLILALWPLMPRRLRLWAFMNDE